VDKLAPRSCFTAPRYIFAETELSQCTCGGRLKVQKTQTKDVVLLDFGELIFNETVKYCARCGSIYGSEKLKTLVPEYSNFGFDVVEFIGKKLFVENYTETKIHAALVKRNVKISFREISFLGQKFVQYLAQAHKNKKTEIGELIRQNGGYIAHLDSTCEGASPHIFCVVEEQLKLALLSRKISSESTDEIIPILEELKSSYGCPLVFVCDMSKAIVSAIEKVFPGIRIFICHFHYIRDLGKDLLKVDYELFVSMLRGYNVKATLSRFAREFRILMQKYPAFSQHLGSDIDNVFSQNLPEEVLAHLLIEWIQNYPADLAGYGFPFDRSHLEQVKRMEEAYEHLQELPLKPSDHLSKIKEFLENVLCDKELQICIRSVKRKVEHFDKLRDIMRIASPEGKNGLNDDGEQVNMSDMRREIEKFIAMDEIRGAALRDDGYKKMLIQIEKYKERLFIEGIETVDAKGNKRYSQPQRTNNILERFFRTMKRGVRQRIGNKSMSSIFKTLIAETPYISNLNNPEYLRVILNGKETLAECFAEIDGELIRKAMRKHNEAQDRLKPSVKRAIESQGVLVKIIEAYAI
jgi:hypothetical protein